MWYTIIHIAFVVSALFLAFIDRVTGDDQGTQQEQSRRAPKS